MVEHKRELPVAWFASSRTACRFARIRSVMLENDWGAGDTGLCFPRFELVLRPGGVDASEGSRESGAPECAISRARPSPGGLVCVVVRRTYAAWGWEGVRYRVEAEDAVRLYCEELSADITATP